jgi:hypothetical protein
MPVLGFRRIRFSSRTYIAIHVAHLGKQERGQIHAAVTVQFPVTAAAEQKLEPFPESDAPLVTTRDFGLAWETLTERRVAGASLKRPFHKAGPQVFLDKIPAEAWKEFITAQFRKRSKTIDDAALTSLLDTADLIPYDVQRIAHELWDYAELKDKRAPNDTDVNTVIDKLVIGQSTYYGLLWEQLPARQRAALQALTHRGAAELYSQAVREEFRLGPASSVQKALQSLDSQDILDRYRGEYFFLDPLLPCWIRTKTV